MKKTLTQTTMSTSTNIRSPVNYTNPCMEWHMLFICPECGEEYTSQQDWRRHLNEDHNYIRKTAKDFNFTEINERFHQCNECHKWVANAHQAVALLQYHRFLHLPFSRTYRCRHCSAAFARKRALSEHLYAHHGRILARMEKLHKAEQVAAAASLRNPKENPEFYLRFLCPQCNKSIDRFQQWLHHLDTAHYATSTDLRMHRIPNTNDHFCKQCKVLFHTSNKAVLQRHRFVHLPHRLYFQCAFCTVKKAYKSEVLRHFVRCHPQVYQGAKDYVRKPIEWGGEISATLKAELDMLLRPQVPTTKKPTDIIQKALFNSRIDLELETMDEDNDSWPPDNAQNKLIKTISKVYSNIPKREPELELEKLCSAVFDELDEEDGISGGGGKPLKRKLSPPIGPAAKKACKPQTVDERLIRLEIDPVTKSAAMPLTAARRQELIKPQSGVLKATTKKSNAQVHDQLLNKVLETYVTFLCPDCGIQFREHTPWRSHVVKAHGVDHMVEKKFRFLDGGRGYLCLFCKIVQKTISTTELQRHYFTHMTYKHYMKCNLCGECRPSRPRIIEHLKSRHKEMCETLTAKLTGMTSTSSKTVSPKYHCDNCGKNYITEARWERHRRQCTELLNEPAKYRKYNINENLKLLVHLKKARLRIESRLRELGLEPSSAKLL